jgi:tripeptide aminopeptidase
VDHLDLNRLDADIAYTIDGGGTGSIYTETFNAAEAVVEIRGVMVHPGYAKDIMVNAVRILSELLVQLPAGEAPESTDGREGYIHPHMIYQSDAASARAKIILRDFTEDGLARRKELLESLVSMLRIKHPRAQIHLEITDQYRNMRSYIDERDARAITYAYAAAESIGLSLREQLVRGGTDGARLSELGIPTPNVFNGGHNFHSRFEWNTVQSLELSLRYVKALVRCWGENA